MMNKIIINADDFGKSKAINHGILTAFTNGFINQTTLMVNMPFCQEAVDLVKNTPYANSVGLHLNLTEGQPLTLNIQSIHTLCKDGEFNGDIRKIARTRPFSFVEKAAIREEIKAQVDLFLSLGLELRHLDSHHHIHTEFRIFNLLFPFVSTFSSVRLARNLQKHTFSSIFKRIYKGCFNLKIKSHFSDYTRYFGSYSDYHNFYKQNSGSVEVMVHPILKDGIVYDILSKDVLIDMRKYYYE